MGRIGEGGTLPIVAHAAVEPNQPFLDFQTARIGDGGEMDVDLVVLAALLAGPLQQGPQLLDGIHGRILGGVRIDGDALKG